MYPKSKELDEFKKSFEDYVQFWEEWSNYKFNGLDETDVYIINVFKSKNFTFTLDDMLMFYFKKNVIKSITLKLKKNQVEFKHWLFCKFSPNLLKLAVDYVVFSEKTYQDIKTEEERLINIESFFKSDIEILILNNEIKRVLMNFGFKTLNDLIENVEENFHNQKQIFINVKEFLCVIKNQKNYSRAKT